MWKYLLTITLSFSLGMFYAQTCSLTGAQVQYQDQLRDAVEVSVSIPVENLKDGFNDFVKDQFDVNLQGYGFLSRKDEVNTDFFTSSAISDRPVDIIGLFRDNGKGTILYLLAKWEDGTFVEKQTNPSTFESLLNVGHDFLQVYVPRFYNEVLEEANEDYEDSAKELKKTKDDLQKSEDDLIKLRQEIVELEDEITGMKKEIINLESELDKSQNRVAEKREDLKIAIQALSSIRR